MPSAVRVLPAIARALAERRPVVALESSVFAQGLPVPTNAEAARRMTEAVSRERGVPAVTAIVAGTPAVGLEAGELERFLRQEGVRKVTARDLPGAMVSGRDGATTVAATLCLAHLAGIEVFATGGIGGVHRASHPGEPTFDESADLAEMARTPMVVVCAGAKSILDLHATWERLETLGIPVVGYRTSELPGFFTAQTGIPLGECASSAGGIAALFRAHRALGRAQAMLVVQAPPPEYALDAESVERAVTSAVRDANRDGVRGAAMTPYLLERVTRLTERRSLEANVALLEQNAALAAAIGRELSSMPT